MYGFPKRIKFTSVDASDARYFKHSYPELSKWEEAHSPKPNNLIAFQTYTIVDSKKNRVLVFEIWKGVLGLSF